MSGDGAGNAGFDKSPGRIAREGSGVPPAPMVPGSGSEGSGAVEGEGSVGVRGLERRDRTIKGGSGMGATKNARHGSERVELQEESLEESTDVGVAEYSPGTGPTNGLRASRSPCIGARAAALLEDATSTLPPESSRAPVIEEQESVTDSTRCTSHAAWQRPSNVYGEWVIAEVPELVLSMLPRDGPILGSLSSSE